MPKGSWSYCLFIELDQLFRTTSQEKFEDTVGVLYCNPYRGIGGHGRGGLLKEKTML